MAIKDENQFPTSADIGLLASASWYFASMHIYANVEPVVLRLPRDDLKVNNEYECL
jgi:hypothetical protein